MSVRMSTSKQPRDLIRPTPGFYLVRLVPKGWQVGAEITLIDGRYGVTVDGVEIPGSWTDGEIAEIATDSIAVGKLYEHPLLRVSAFGEPCTRGQYNYRIAMKLWATAHQPDHPAANPTRRLSPLDMPMEF